MKSKKIIVIAIILIMALMLAACGNLYVPESYVGYGYDQTVQRVMYDKVIHAGDSYYEGAKLIFLGVQTQSFEFGNGSSVSGTSKEGTEVFIRGTGVVRYQVTSEEAGLWLIKNFPNYEQGLITTIDFLNAVKGGINKIPAAQVTYRDYTHGPIMEALQEMVDEIFSAYPKGSAIKILSVQAPEMGFSAEFNAKLDAAGNLTMEIQNTEKQAELQKKQLEIQKEKELAEAQIASEKAKIEAETASTLAKKDAEDMAAAVKALIDAGLDPKQAAEVVMLDRYCEVWDGTTVDFERMRELLR